jgi:hypothetical protein
MLIGVEKFLKIRGVLEPSGGTHHGFETQKEERENFILVGSHYL